MGHDIKAFELAFKQACLAHNVCAAFVIAVADGAKGSRIYVGGEAELSDYVESQLVLSTTEAKKPKH